MKTDILTYITRSLVKQRGLNVIATAAIAFCIYRIGQLSLEIKALKAEGETMNNA